jgi:hypothetical protein
MEPQCNGAPALNTTPSVVQEVSTFITIFYVFALQSRGRWYVSRYICPQAPNFVVWELVSGRVYAFLCQLQVLLSLPTQDKRQERGPPSDWPGGCNAATAWVVRWHSQPPPPPPCQQPASQESRWLRRPHKRDPSSAQPGPSLAHSPALDLCTPGAK